MQARKLLSKQNRLILKSDFKKVFENGKPFFSNFFILRFNRNGLSASRFGFVVGLKVSKKAVVRNLIKRRIRAALREIIKNIKFGQDIVFAAKPAIIGKSFKEIKEEMEVLLKKAGLMR